MTGKTVTKLALMLALLLCSSFLAFAQMPKVSLNVQKVTARQLLKAIEAKTDYTFAYVDAELDLDKIVSVKAENKDVTSILSDIWPGVKVTMNGRQLIINSPSKQANNDKGEIQVPDVNPFRRVTGVVTDESGQPVIGAVVMQKGTRNAAMTSNSGYYVLESVEGLATISVSCLGYREKEVAISANQTECNIRIEQELIALDDVVVVGYATMKKRDLVGSVDAVGSEVVGNRANSNLLRSLQGEIPGLNITISDSKPSHEGSYNVRGETSVGAGGDALVLIDGVEGSLSSVNPQDVESISVLKDASSAAVYGARGALGVILVTTKAAQKGRPVVNYSGSFSLNRRTIIPDGITDPIEWLDWWKAAYVGSYNSSRTLLNNLDGKAPYSEDIYNEIIRRKNDPSLAKVVRSDAISGFGYAYLDSHDWMKEFYNDVHGSTEHNLSVSGGNENADYYVSGRYYSSDGVFRVGDEKYKKFNMRAKGTLKIRPWLVLTNNMSISTNWSHIPRTANGQSPYRYIQHCLQPMTPLKNPDGTWTPASGTSGYAAFVEGNNYIEDDYIYLRDKIALDASLIKNVLKIQADYSYNYTGRTRLLVQNMVAYSKEPGITLYESEKYGDGLTQNTYRTDYQSANIYATWTPKLGEKHSLTALLGYNVEWRTYKTTTDNKVGFITNKPSFALMEGEASITSGGNEWSYLGAFYRVNYSFLGRYLLEVSGRYDGSSKFPINSRWGFFPSASLGWRLSDEPWMRWSRGVLDNAKIRISAGSMGNGNVSPYKYTSTMSIKKATDIVIDGSLPSYTSVASLVPSTLTWETATTYDAGIDIDLFKNRFSATFDYYIRNTTDMYTTGVTLPPVFGASAPKGNYAAMQTKGWELSLQWRDQFNLGGKPFKYSVKGTLWDSRSFITKFDGNDGNSLGTISDIIGQEPQYYVGMELGELWGYEVEGLFRDYEDIANHATQDFLQARDAVTRPGQVKFADRDKSNFIDYGNLTLADHGDFLIVGNKSPRYRYGVNLSASWNGIGLSMFFQGVGKRDWYPGNDASYFWGKYDRPFLYFLPKIHAMDLPTVCKLSEDGSECLNPDTAYWPRITSYQSDGYAGKRYPLAIPNTRYIQNAAFVRLKNIQLDYTFGQKVCKAIGVSSLKIFINGENLFAYTPMWKWAPNIDPETAGYGDSDYNDVIDGNSYPMLKTVTLGLNLKF